jgi:hypothetical protein
LSESDLIRERVSNNIGQASDEQISRLAVTARIVVSVSAGTPIYVVLEQPARTDAPGETSVSSAARIEPTKMDELRQLLQLQRELRQASATEQ